jgi:hypothetical protein
MIRLTTALRGMFAAAVVCMLISATVFAQRQMLYLMCNHTNHNEGRWVRVGGPWDRIAPCDEAREAHYNNHGFGQQRFSVQCSWRSVAP